MNKGIIAGLVIAAVAAAGGGYYLQQQSAVGGGESSLSYVPADTLIFSGALEPASWQDNFAVLQTRWQGLIPEPDQLQSELDKLAKELDGEGQSADAGLRMLLGLYGEFATALQRGEQAPAALGLGDKVDQAFYTVGALPVLRVKLADEAAFDRFIQAAETRFQAKGEQAQLDGVSYRRYPFATDGEFPLALVLAKQAGFAVLTLDTGDLIPAEQGLKPALGLVKPAHSLADSDLLAQLVKQHGFEPFALGYLNHLGLVQGITRADSPLAQLADKLSHGQASQELAPWRSQGCQQDLEGMAALWPRTLFGYTKLERSAAGLSLGTAGKLESTDAAAMTELQKLQGFVPKDAKGLLAVNLGLNVDALAPVLSQLWGRATQASFSCEPLVALQQDLKQSNPAMLGMMTGMIQGLQGLGVELQDLKLGAEDPQSEMPKIEALSFTAHVSASKPEQLWGMLGMLDPQLAQLPLPAEGQSVDLPLPPMFPLPQGVKLARYGQHLALYSGEAGAARAAEIGQQPLTGNGLYQMHLDYGLLADVLDKALDEVAEDAKAKAEQAQLLQQFEQLRGVTLDSRLDLAADGVVVSADMLVPKG